MKVLHINTYDQGGAAIAIRRIHEGLLKKGVDSKLLLLHKTKSSKEAYSYWEGLPKPVNKNHSLIVRILEEMKKTLYSRLHVYFRKNKLIHEQQKKDRLNSLISKVEVFSYPTSDFDITKHPLYKEADIIQLNWVSGFLDEPSFFKNNTKPVIWRMPDLYACGGGYHYEKNFLFDELKDELLNNYLIRQNSLKFDNLTFVPISKWVNDKANESELIRKFDKQIIGNGLDLSVFKPMNQRESRILFNLPLDKKIILFGAQDLKNKRKGFDLFLQSIGLLDMANIVCCSFGQKYDSKNLPIINVGSIEDERLLCMLYSAADLFIMPSIEEAFGQVTIEALACGTPVVSFPAGGSLDILINDFNGFIAEDFTSESLAFALNKAIRYPFEKASIRKDVENRFNIDDKVEEYLDLYKKKLSFA